MTKLFWLLLLSLFAGGFAAAQDSNTPLTPMVHVNLSRYLGKWYEIATIPQYFERICVSDTTAEYSFLSKSQIKVENACTTGDRTRTMREGRGKVVDTASNAKLKVTFAHLGDSYFYSFGGKYWILYVDSSYKYAIVGHPNRRYGWILARSPQVSASILQDLAVELQMRGYDTCQFVTTPQKNGLSMRSRLCDVINVDTVEADLE